MIILPISVTYRRFVIMSKCLKIKRLRGFDLSPEGEEGKLNVQFSRKKNSRNYAKKYKTRIQIQTKEIERNQRQNRPMNIITGQHNTF